MALRKYQSVEKTQIVSPQDHREIESNLHKLGKTSAAQLNDDERRSLDKPHQV